MKKIIKIFSLCLLFILVISTIFSYTVNATNVVTNAYNNLPESQLGLTNILNIILISVGVVLILLGIAILIKLKQM